MKKILIVGVIVLVASFIFTQNISAQTVRTFCARVSALPTLSLGSSGQSVKDLQGFLNSIGSSLTVDGSYGPATSGAVSNFNTSHGVFAGDYSTYANTNRGNVVEATLVEMKKIACGDGVASSDTIPPSISITAPMGGTTVSGDNVNITVNAADNVGVTKVEFYRNGLLWGTDLASPWGVIWTTTTYQNGQHTIYAKAYDAAGNVGTSTNVNIIVTNSTNPPAGPAQPDITFLTSKISGKSYLLWKDPQNVSQCTGINFSTGTRLSTTGSVAITPTQRTTYSIVCYSNVTALSVTKSITVDGNGTVTPALTAYNPPTNNGNYPFCARVSALPTLSLGSSGQSVKDLQGFLNSIGSSLTVDGSYGPATSGAVSNFNTSHGVFAGDYSTYANTNRGNVVEATLVEMKKIACGDGEVTPPALNIITTTLSATPASTTSAPLAPSTLVTFNWTATGGANDCQGSFSSDGVPGQATDRPTQTKTYTISCGRDGVASSYVSSQPVTVYVASPTNQSTVTSTFTASPTSSTTSPLNVGTKVTLTWSSTNATKCTGYRETVSTSTTDLFTTGNRTSGSYDITPAKTATYTLDCSTATLGSNVSKSVTVFIKDSEVTPTTFAVNLSATPSSIPSSQPVTLAWNATGASTCNGNGWSTGTGNPTSGQVQVNPTATTTYTITCYNSSGLWKQSTATVTIGSTPPVTTQSTSTAFIFGDKVKTTVAVNYRDAAGGNILGQKAAGATGTIATFKGVDAKIYDPVQNRSVNHTWWGVDWGTGYYNWVAEDNLVKIANSTNGDTSTKIEIWANTSTSGANLAILPTENLALYWKSTGGATNCILTGTGTVSGNYSTGVSAFTTAYSSTAYPGQDFYPASGTSGATYTISCNKYNAAGTLIAGAALTDSVKVNITAPVLTPTVDMKVLFGLGTPTDGPLSVAANVSGVNLSWASTNLTGGTCTVRNQANQIVNPNFNAVNNPPAGLGVNVASGANTFTISCTGSNGTATDSVVVNVGTADSSNVCSPVTGTTATQNISCPTGQTGSITQTRTMGASPACAWTPWATSVTNCVTPPNSCSTTAAMTQTISCPTGQTGSITQTRTLSAYPSCVLSAWSTTSSNCTAGQSTPPSIGSFTIGFSGSIPYGTNPPLYWSSSNTSSCSINGTDVPTNGSYYTSFGPLTQSQTLTLSCVSSAGVSATPKSVYINVAAQVNNTNPPTVNVLVNGSHNTAYVGYEDSVNVSWSATNVSSCTNPLSQSINTTTSGTISQSPTSSGLLTSTRSFTVGCTGLDGSFKYDSVSVVVSSAPVDDPTNDDDPACAGDLLCTSGITPNLIFANALTAADSLSTTPAFPISSMLSVKAGVTLNIRASAGTTGTIIGKQKGGVSGHIIEGPINIGGYRWWKVDYLTGVDGWSAGEYLEVKN